jgi:hypothetical protein
MKSSMRRLAYDTRGEVASSTFQFAVTWFVTFFVFLMNVMLGQLFYRRDAVDHGAALAADIAKKTYCMKEENVAATEAEANKAIRSIMQTAGGNAACQLAVKPKGDAGDPGAKKLEVKLSCSFECKIPIAAQAMC